MKRYRFRILLAVLLLLLTGCGRKMPEEAETTAADTKKQVVRTEEQDAVFELGDKEDLEGETGVEEEEALTYAEKFHDPETVFEHYGEPFVVTAPLGAYVRENTYSSADIIGFMEQKAGGTLLLQSVDLCWYEVRSGSLHGYVSAGSIAVGSRAETLMQVWAEERVRVIETTVLSANADGSGALRSAVPGEVFDYLETCKDRYRVRLSDRTEAWIQGSCCEQGLLLSEALEKKMNGITICLDPFDVPEGEKELTGCISGIEASRINRVTAQAVREELEERGYRVFLLDQGSREERLREANRIGADLVIYLKCLQSELPEISGGTVSSSDSPETPESLRNAERVFAEVLSVFLNEATGEEAVAAVYSAEYEELDRGTNTSVVWGLGYLTNPSDDRKLNREEYRVQLSRGAADAIDRYFGAER